MSFGGLRPGFLWHESVQEQPLGRLLATSGASSGSPRPASGSPGALLGLSQLLLGFSWAPGQPKTAPREFEKAKKSRNRKTLKNQWFFKVFGSQSYSKRAQDSPKRAPRRPKTASREAKRVLREPQATSLVCHGVSWRLSGSLGAL